MPSFKIRFKRTLPVLLIAHIPVIGMAAGILLFHFIRGAPLSSLWMISSLSAAIWSFSATIYSFCYSLLSQKALNENPKGFLIFSACFAWLLFLDGLLSVQAEISSLSILERLVKPVYLLFLLYYVLRYWKTLHKGDVILWGLAFGCFSAFILTEAHSLGPRFVERYLLEDAPKFLGLAAWGAYAFRTSRRFMLYEFRRSKEV
jgi:hypothetical protein